MNENEFNKLLKNPDNYIRLEARSFYVEGSHGSNGIALWAIVNKNDVRVKYLVTSGWEYSQPWEEWAYAHEDIFFDEIGEALECFLDLVEDEE